jgi:3-deoxy-manno-octulosonate cytidylyltransferase (CMP-KDO synthetase)
MKIAAIIPSRYQSTRFPGKPLTKIKGRTMIERVYLQVQKSGRFADIVVATDDQRIVSEVQRFGGVACLTSKQHQSGTDRLWEVVSGRDYDAVVNIQGDEPLIPEAFIADFYDELERGGHRVLSAAHFNRSYRDFMSEHVVKVVCDENNQALQFSRSPIPWQQEDEFQGFYHHIGIYGYIKSALKAFVESHPCEQERQQRLEQLRFFSLNIPIYILKTQYSSLGVDVPEDVSRIEAILANGESS